jgi:integration host factor subunit alpha
MYANHKPCPAPRIFESAESKPDRRSRTVTPSDFAAAINKRMQKLSLREAAQILDRFLQEIADALLSRMESVNLHDFGTFLLRERAARRGRNPITGETAAIGERRTVIFRSSNGLREKVEQSPARGRAPRS